MISGAQFALIISSMAITVVYIVHGGLEIIVAICLVILLVIDLVYYQLISIELPTKACDDNKLIIEHEGGEPTTQQNIFSISVITGPHSESTSEI